MTTWASCSAGRRARHKGSQTGCGPSGNTQILLGLSFSISRMYLFVHVHCIYLYMIVCVVYQLQLEYVRTTMEIRLLVLHMHEKLNNNQSKTSLATPSVSKLECYPTSHNVVSCVDRSINLVSIDNTQRNSITVNLEQNKGTREMKTSITRKQIVLFKQELSIQTIILKGTGSSNLLLQETSQR